MSNTPLLNVNNVSKTFPRQVPFWQKILGISPGGITALEKVCFFLPQDSIMGIIGESGCGKTTLAKVLTRIENVDEGTVYYKERQENILELSEDDFIPFRSRIQMIFQNPYGALNPRLSTYQTLKEPLRKYKKGHSAYEEAVRALHMVGLTSDYLERYPHEMSGGQRQRVNIARALTVQPEILIADEPVSALDVSTQINILNLLKNIQQQISLSFLFITHDLGIAKYICDQILVMYLGQVVEWADKEEFFRKPRHPYSEMLLQSVPKFKDRHDRRQIPSGERQKTEDGCLFAPRCSSVMPICHREKPQITGDFPQVRCFRYR